MRNTVTACFDHRLVEQFFLLPVEYFVMRRRTDYSSSENTRFAQP